MLVVTVTVTVSLSLSVCHSVTVTVVTVSYPVEVKLRFDLTFPIPDRRSPDPPFQLPNCIRLCFLRSSGSFSILHGGEENVDLAEITALLEGIGDGDTLRLWRLGDISRWHTKLEETHGEVSPPIAILRMLLLWVCKLQAPFGNQVASPVDVASVKGRSFREVNVIVRPLYPPFPQTVLTHLLSEARSCVELSIGTIPLGEVLIDEIFHHPFIAVVRTSDALLLEEATQRLLDA